MKRAVDNPLRNRLVEGAELLGVPLSSPQADLLLRYQTELLAWNRKINLTAITRPEEVVEKHLLDSVAALPEVRAGKEVLDMGAGGGLPGIPLAILLPEVRFTLVDAVAKKVGFLKAAAAGLGLRNVRAIHVHAEGRPGEEGLPTVDIAICRAFMAPEEWLALASHYLAEGGRAVAMLGGETAVPAALPAGFRVASEREFALPFGGGKRRIAVFER